MPGRSGKAITPSVMNLKVYDSKDFPAYLPKLGTLYDDLFAGGKGFRAKLIQMISGHVQLDPKAVHLLAQTIEFIHNASLLHDDLIDGSKLRRGKTAAWLRFTPEYAVLAGDYLLARVMVNLSGHGNIRLVQYTAEMISDLLEGEWLQDSLVGDFALDLSQLDRVHNLKTASLFKWCLRSPFIALERYEPGLHTCLDEAGTLLGQLFQRGDDLLDFNIRNFEGKTVLGDLKSGYMNSFAAFATIGMSLPERKKLQSCAELSDFIKAIGGEQNFQSACAEFDKKNEFLIQLYQHHLNQLKSYLKSHELGLVDKLMPLPDLLYWRKQ